MVLWMNSIKGATIKTAKSFSSSIFVLFGMIMLISLVLVIAPFQQLNNLSTNNPIVDSFFGSVIGSISAGTPITSYLVGGELLNNGMDLFFVIAFLVSWTTVGLIQIPAESLMLGKDFAIKRNVINFVCSILISLITVFVLGLLWKII